MFGYNGENDRAGDSVYCGVESFIIRGATGAAAEIPAQPSEEHTPPLEIGIERFTFPVLTLAESHLAESKATDSDRRVVPGGGAT